MASKLKRVSDTTEAKVAALAERENRTFVAQLDRVVEAGLEKLGETEPKSTPRTRAPRKAAATAS